MKKSTKVMAVIGAITVMFVAWIAMIYGIDAWYYASDMDTATAGFLLGVFTAVEIQIGVKFVKNLFVVKTTKAKKGEMQVKKQEN